MQHQTSTTTSYMRVDWRLKDIGKLCPCAVSCLHRVVSLRVDYCVEMSLIFLSLPPLEQF